MVEVHITAVEQRVVIRNELALPGSNSERFWRSLYVPGAVLAEPIDVQRVWVIADMRGHYHAS